jgi:hypothetical protein
MFEEKVTLPINKCLGERFLKRIEGKQYEK